MRGRPADLALPRRRLRLQAAGGGDRAAAGAAAAPAGRPGRARRLRGADDAGVYRLRDDLALVQTVDFFTPIVDDPFDFGRIAAANALSDVYAMGAHAGQRAQPGRVLARASSARRCSLEILRGGAAVAEEAGVAILGGHSIEDAEPKYGLAVTGVVHPDEVLTNAGGRAGRRARADQAARRRRGLDRAQARPRRCRPWPRPSR